MGEGDDTKTLLKLRQMSHVNKSYVQRNIYKSPPTSRTTYLEEKGPWDRGRGTRNSSETDLHESHRREGGKEKVPLGRPEGRNPEEQESTQDPSTYLDETKVLLRGGSRDNPGLYHQSDCQRITGDILPLT